VSHLWFLFFIVSAVKTDARKAALHYMQAGWPRRADCDRLQKTPPERKIGGMGRKRRVADHAKLLPDLHPFGWQKEFSNFLSKTLKFVKTRPLNRDNR
jgi:hypothetical protein